MQNLYKKLLEEVLFLELPIFRTPKKRKNPFRWIIVDSYSKHMGNGEHYHTATRLLE